MGARAAAADLLPLLNRISAARMGRINSGAQSALLLGVCRVGLGIA